MTPDLLAVRKAVLDNLVDVPVDAPVLVACSGGADSLALAAGAAMLPRPVAAAVIDHGLQAGSRGVAQTAAEACRVLGLQPVVLRTVQVGQDGGPEAAARSARYAALRQIAGELDAVAILLAHTLDDQAETVLLRLARGSGSRSLSAMAPVAGDLRRPLLGLRRSQVRKACADAGLPAFEDPHNADDRFARARLRHHGLPGLVEDLGDGVVSGLARSAELLRQDNDALDAWACGVDYGSDPVRVDVGQIGTLPVAVLHRVLRRMALAAGCPAGSLTSGHVRSVAALVHSWRGQGPVDLPGGVRAARKSGTLVLSHQEE